MELFSLKLIYHHFSPDKGEGEEGGLGLEDLEE